MIIKNLLTVISHLTQKQVIDRVLKQIIHSSNIQASVVKGFLQSLSTVTSELGVPHVIKDLSRWLSTGSLCLSFCLLFGHVVVTQKGQLEEFQTDHQGLKSLISSPLIGLATFHWGQHILFQARGDFSEFRQGFFAFDGSERDLKKVCHKIRNSRGLGCFFTQRDFCLEVYQLTIPISFGFLVAQFFIQELEIGKKEEGLNASILPAHHCVHPRLRIGVHLQR